MGSMEDKSCAIVNTSLFHSLYLFFFGKVKPQSQRFSIPIAFFFFFWGILSWIIQAEEEKSKWDLCFNRSVLMRLVSLRVLGLCFSCETEPPGWCSILFHWLQYAHSSHLSLSLIKKCFFILWKLLLLLRVSSKQGISVLCFFF